jgi:K+-transporting ATPase c subunit
LATYCRNVLRGVPVPRLGRLMEVVPVEEVTGHERLSQGSSGSGYDPDISALDATVQIPMVQSATGLSSSTLRHLISQETQGAALGFMGTSYIDVLQLNEALAKLEK